MKRLLLAAALAIGLHALLVTSHFGRFQRPELGAMPGEPIALTLDARLATVTTAQPKAVAETPPWTREPPDATADSDASISEASTSAIDQPLPGLASDDSTEGATAAEANEADGQVDAPATVTKEPAREQVPAPAPQPPSTRPVQPPRQRPRPARSPVLASAASRPAARESHTDTAAASASSSEAPALAVPSLREAIPLYRHNPPPRYPRIARLNGYEGTVVLEVHVGASGAVRDCRVQESSGYAVLDRAAVKTARDWLFEPGRQGEDTVAMWVKVPIRFQLN